MNKKMPCNGLTPLWVSLKAKREEDYTEMVRLLLSKGANPAAPWTDPSDGMEILPLEAAKNITMRYWVRVALTQNARKIAAVRKNYKREGLERLVELQFAAVGQNYALRRLKAKILGHYSCQDIDRKKPLVLLLPGPPGHGKTVRFHFLFLLFISS